MRKKRSNIDFSKHIHTSIKNSEVCIDKLHRVDENGAHLKEMGVTFINCEGVLTVTGDFCNFVFYKEFHPSPDGEVSDSYWLSKLKEDSCQQPLVFDHEETTKQIQTLRKYLEDNFYDDPKNLRDALAYCDGCDDANGDVEWAYDAYAYGEKPDCIDWEDVPRGTVLVEFLPEIFDAFEEICKRLSLIKKDDVIKNIKKNRIAELKASIKAYYKKSGVIILISVTVLIGLLINKLYMIRILLLGVVAFLIYQTLELLYWSSKEKKYQALINRHTLKINENENMNKDISEEENGR